MSQEPEQPDTESRQVEAFEPLPGELLVVARRARGISPERVAESLNLDVSVVYALEDNRFEELGAPVFARGHLRKYARLLDLDPGDILRAYDAVAKEQSAAALTTSPTLAEARPPVTRNWVKPLLIALAAVAVAVVLWSILSNGEPATDIGPAAEPTAAAGDSVSGGEDLGSGRIPIPPRTPQPSADPAAEADSSAAEAPAPEADDAPDQQIAAPAPGRSAPAAPAPETRPASAGGPTRVVFSFERDSWLEVRDADGHRLAYEMGRGGRTRTVTGRAPMTVSLGFVEGVEITVDGERFSVPASAIQGNTARFSIGTSPASTN